MCAGPAGLGVGAQALSQWARAGLLVAGGRTQSESTGVSQADFGGSCSRHCFLRASCVLGDEADKFLLLQSWHPVGVKGGGGQLGLSLPRLPSVGSLKSAMVGVFASQRLTHATNQAFKNKSLTSFPKFH